MTTQDIDVKLTQGADGLWDINLDANGQLVVDDSFETTIALTIFGERRATEGEVATPANRRGWIGSVLSDIPGFEPGSKGWLFYQSRLTSETVTGIKNAHQEALEWMIEDGLAKSILVTSRQNGLLYIVSGRKFNI